MITKIAHRGKLSQGQITRLGGLIAFVCGRTPYEHILQDLYENNFLDHNKNAPELTIKGREELNRLTAMAGLRPEHYADT
jgi:hypothetical protein